MNKKIWNGSRIGNKVKVKENSWKYGTEVDVCFKEIFKLFHNILFNFKNHESNVFFIVWKSYGIERCFFLLLNPLKAKVSFEEILWIVFIISYTIVWTKNMNWKISMFWRNSMNFVHIFLEFNERRNINKFYTIKQDFLFFLINKSLWVSHIMLVL